MTKNLIDLKFVNNRFGCKYTNGRCPNYKSDECGKGGKKIYKKFGYDLNLKVLKEAFKVDHTFGCEYHADKNRIRREKNNG